MVQRRMRSAILEIGSFWYSAWVDAGQPDLNKLIDKPLSIQEKKRYSGKRPYIEWGKYWKANEAGVTCNRCDFRNEWI